MSRALKCAEVVLTVVVLLVAGLAIAWRASGGSYYAVQTASMGTAAPVGSLLLDRPAAALQVGELISFRPPGSGRIFTHRIVAISADGQIHTKGDINSAVDGWALRRSDVVGRVVAIIRYAGWLVRALPILAVGALLVLLLTRWWVVGPWRPVARASGVTVVIVAAVTIMRPLVGSSLIVFGHGDGGAAAAVVSTGVLPVRVSAVGGSSDTITDGQVARVWTNHTGPSHRYELSVTPAWQLWWIAPLLLLTMLPAFLSLTVEEPAGVGAALADLTEAVAIEPPAPVPVS